MSYKEAIQKIKRILGVYNFNTYVIKETNNQLVTDGDLTVGEPIYTLTENGYIPAQTMNVELEDGTTIKIEDGIVKEIKYDMNKELFVEAITKDGVIIKSPNFDIDDEVMVIDAEGNEVAAPDGDHEIIIKDAEGVESRIKIKVQDGKIMEREMIEDVEPEIEVEVEVKEEEMEAELSEGNDEFKKMIMEQIKSISDKLDLIVKDQEEMKSQVEKFSKAPAAAPVMQPKNFASELNELKNDKFAQLVQIRRGLK